MASLRGDTSGVKKKPARVPQTRLLPELGNLPDLSKLRDVAAGMRVGEATPSFPDGTVIERVIVVLKPEGALTRTDVERAMAFAKHAAIQAEKIPLVGVTKFDDQ